MEQKTYSAYKKIINSVEGLYEVVFRNGFMLPKLHSSIVTEQYLHGVADSSIYCPMADDLKYK